MYFRGESAKKLGTAVIAAVLVMVAMPAYAKNYCVVISKHLSPYQSAHEGIVEVLGDDTARFDLYGKLALGPDLVGAIEKEGCDVIIPVGSTALDAVFVEMRDKIIVYTMVSSLPSSLEGAPNVAGVDLDIPPGPYFDVIKKILPTASRVGVVYDSEYAADYVEKMKMIAPRYDIELVTRTITSMKMLPKAVRYLVARSDVLLMVPDPTSSNRKAFEYMLLESARKGIPLIGLSKKHVRDGALFSFALDYNDIGRKSGEMARRAAGSLGAAKSYDPKLKTELVINAKTAKRLGLRIDPALLRQAVEVYK